MQRVLGLQGFILTIGAHLKQIRFFLTAVEIGKMKFLTVAYIWLTLSV